MSALQAAEQAWQASEADFFSRSYGLLARYDHDSFSWKYAKSMQRQEIERNESDGILPQDVAYAVGPRQPNFQRRAASTEKSGKRTADDPSWWNIEPDVGRVAHGVPNRVDRLRGLGNAVVPQQAREAFERLIGFK
jgi:hypothetical protein